MEIRFNKRVEARRHNWTAPKIFAAAVGGTVLAVVLGFLFGWVIEHLWNWLMPALFYLKPMTYWQGVGLFVLAKMLFGGVPGSPHHGHGRGYHHRPCGDDDPYCGDWKVRGSHKDWKYYDRYWKEEGKAAFEAYLDRMEEKAEGKETGSRG